MARRITEIRVGIAVLLALIIVVAGVTWLSEFRVARERVSYIVRFSDVGGLAVGDPVTVSGVKKGRVEGIDLIRGGVAVELSVDRDAVITQGSLVYVRNVGLIGEKFIAIDLIDEGPVYAAGDTIIGVYESGIPEVISQMGDALTALQRVSDQIDRILAVAEDRGTVETTLKNVEAASTDFSATLAENREDLRETARNFKNVSSRLRTMVDEKGPVVEETVDRLSVTSARIDTLVANLEALTDDVARMTTHIESDSTTLGKIMTDRELYDDLRVTLRELNLLMQDVKRNPGKYFKFSLF